MNPPRSSFEKQLGGELLAGVSRSFYLSLRFLPRRLRAPMGLAYLLARATDTVADAPGDPARRAGVLEGLLADIAGGTRAAGNLVWCGETPAERRLMESIGICLDWLEALGDEDREEIRWVLSRIGRGQALDLARFELSGDGIRTAAELEEYTWLVAGCVGEFWTRMAFRHYPGYSRVGVARLSGRGAAFGRGLQLVNILRDYPEDLAGGRCYLPAEELAAAGVEPAALAADPERARAVFFRWWDRAWEQLQEGMGYGRSVRVRRIRFACLLPARVGLRTLELVRERFPARGLKISRAEMRRQILFSVLASLRW